MDLQEYRENKKALYERFAKAVGDILRTSIAQENYHLQQIQYRAKDPRSLQEKLETLNIVNSNKIEEEIFDIAGCRIIFYYNDDVNRFLQSGIISDNFDINWNKIKVRYPQRDSASANARYIANHYIIKLKQERISLPEYKDYEGLWCEIQIHTILNHAWSETNHNIIYKKPKVEGFGNKLLKTIEEKLIHVMEKYLLPAGHEFQKIQHDYQQLLEGKDLVDINIIQNVSGDIDNNRRYEILEKYKRYVLPNLDELQEDQLNEIITLVELGISSSRNCKDTPIETPFGQFEGRTYHDVVNICLDILTFICYVDVEKIFLVLIKLCTEAKDKKEREKIINTIEKLAKYNIKILEQAGLYVQERLISILESWDNDTLQFLKEIAIKVCMEILNPTVEGISSTYKDMTITRPNFLGTDRLANIRNRSIEIIKKLYDYSASDNEKYQLISALGEATKTPTSGNYQDELLSIIERDSKCVVDFYTNILSKEKYEILSSIEEDVAVIYHRANNIIESSNFSETVKTHSKTLLESIRQFRIQLDSNKEFVIYKTLIGFNPIFYKSWKDKTWSLTEEGNQYRVDKSEEYIYSINEKNFDKWEQRILRCARAKSNGFFCDFLKRLSEQKPDFILILLKNNEADILPFFSSILSGLLKSTRKSDVYLLIEQWINEGKHLYYCARLFDNQNDLDLALLKKIYHKAVSLQDNQTLVQIVVSATACYEKSKEWLIKKLFLPAIKELTRFKNASWTYDLWCRPKFSAVIDTLDNSDIEIILENLLFLDNVDWNIEDILLPIAKKNPAIVIKFFGQRVQFKNQSRDLISGSYKPIPYEFFKLKESLSAIPAKVVEIVSSWYDSQYTNFKYEGAKLLHIIFSDFPKDFEKELLTLLELKNEKNIELVVAVLSNYKGELCLHNTCKTLIQILPEESKWLKEIEIILQNIGIVTGEFGSSEAYERKKKEITGWLSDNNKKVRNFAKNYIQKLDNMIASETRRIEEDIQLRKHQYGSPEDE